MPTQVDSSSEEMKLVDPDILETLLEHPRVGIVIPTLLNSFQMDCKVTAGILPVLDVQLLPLQLSTENIKLTDECILFCEKFNSVLVVRAKIIECFTDRQIRLEVTETLRKEQQREFFRIDAEVCIDHWLPATTIQEVGKEELRRVNLSGNGLRFTTDLDLAENDLLEVSLKFPESPAGTVKAVGRVVRVFKTKSDRQEVAIKLFEVEEATQDKIVSFCLAEQTRRIRLMARM